MSSRLQRLPRRGAEAAAALLIFAAVAANAAPPTGTITGIARDAQQHAEAGVTLRLEANGKEVAHTTTAADGSFSFTGVAPGSYSIAAEKSGVGSGSANVTLAADAGASADVTLLAAAQQPAADITVIAQRLTAAQISIEPQIGASTYSFSSDTIQNLPGGENVPLNQVLLRAPGVDQDNEANGDIHVRNEHLDVQYRINGITLPEGVSFFGQGISPRFANSLQLITGALPAEYGLRTAGIVDIQTKSGLFAPGGSVGIYGGSYDTVQPSFEYGGSSGSFNYFAAGDYLTSSHGIAAVTPSYNAIHDDTEQLHGFAYLDKIIDSSSKMSFMGGTFQGQFQIPNNPGQASGVFSPGDVVNGNAAFTGYDSGLLTEHQVESSSYGIASYLRSEQDFDFQVSGVSKYSRLSFHPDPLGDLLFNGLAERAIRQSFANSLQADGSYKLDTQHTLRSGFAITGERAMFDTNSTVVPDCAPPAAGCQADALSPTGGYATTTTNIVQDGGKTGWLYSFYLQDEYKITPTVTLNYGGRFDVVDEYTQENQISPRINTVWKATDTTTVHAGYAKYFTPPPFELVSTGNVTQFAGTTGAPASPMNSSVKSERADYFDAGVEQQVMTGMKVGIDAYYKYSRNLLDEGQFGAPVILTPFNYHVGFNRGVELSTSYDNGTFSYYGNLAIAQQKAEDISSAQFNFSNMPMNGCPLDDLTYVQTHLVNTDHSQRMTASAGVAYLWLGTRYSADVIAGSGLRTQNPGDCYNQATVPSYEQLNLGVSHKFDLPYGGPFEVRFDVINVLDEVYLLRSQSGVGVFASQYGPRRSFYMGVRKEF